MQERSAGVARRQGGAKGRTARDSVLHWQTGL